MSRIDETAGAKRRRGGRRVFAGMVVAAALGASSFGVSSVVSAGAPSTLTVTPSTVNAGDSIKVSVSCFREPVIFVKGDDGVSTALEGFAQPAGSLWELDHPTDGSATEDHQLRFYGTCGEFQFAEESVTVLAQAATTTTSTTSTSVPASTTSIAPSTTTAPATSPAAATPGAPAASPQRAQPTYTG